MKSLKVLNFKGDEVLAEWEGLNVAGFLHAQEVVRQKIREGYFLVNTETDTVVKELVDDANHVLIPQIQGG
jgi:hypothetical protein